MKDDEPRSARKTSFRRRARIGGLLVFVACAGAVALVQTSNHSGVPQTTQAPPVVADNAASPASDTPAFSHRMGDGGSPAGATPSSVAPPAPSSPLTAAMPEPTAYTRTLVANLTRLDQSSSVTAEQAAEWKTNLLQLVQQGAAGVPAIREYLQKSVDVDFGPSSGQMLGYTSARVAMFGALQQIGGPEAVSVLLETLQTTADPREIALLTQSVETLEPGQHLQEALTAARDRKST